MIKKESEKNPKDVCDLQYLIEMTGGKKHLIKEIIDVFLKQSRKELQYINNAVKEEDFASIKINAHTIKSTVSIMGVSMLIPILYEMEQLGEKAENIQRIKILNENLNIIYNQAIEEIENKKENYA